MPKRDITLYLEDIKDSIKKIKEYTNGLSFGEFRINNMLIDAAARNLEIIGEAANNIDKKTKDKYPFIPWKAMIDMRNKVIHEYFGVDVEILWNTIKEDLLDLEKKLQDIAI